MRFNISLNDEEIKQSGENVLEGFIELSGSVERFYAPASYWKKEQYVKSWRQSFDEGYANKSHSALIVSMRDPLAANFIFAWVLYFEVGKVFVQNKVLFMDEIDSVFDSERVNDYFGGRETINEEGVKISEWEIALEDVVNFFNERI
ncbi:hypothetical protein [Pseudomonas sp. SDO55104_S430]